MAIAKVVYKENASATPEVWMDTTQKTVTSGTMLSGTTALKNDGTGITGNIASKSSSDLTASGATVTAPAGYYASSASKSVASGSATTPSTSITANPTISVDSTGLITASVSGSKSVTPTVSAGYVSSGTAGTVSVSGSNTEQLSTQAGTTITPTESEQTAVASGKFTTGAVKVGAISSTYVGSGITQRDSTDLTASGATVTAPAGYYATEASKPVASGTAGTPTATKGTVSNHSISVTPSVTNTTGYITGSTINGTAVTVDVTELESGTKSITENGTGISVSGYSAVDVDVPGQEPTGIKYIWTDVDGYGPWNVSGYATCAVDGVPLFGGKGRIWVYLTNDLSISVQFAAWSTSAAGVIDWGDGSSDTWEYGALTVSHTYPSGGLYIIEAYPNSESLGFAFTTYCVGQSSSIYDTKVVAAEIMQISFGTTRTAFLYCNNLKRVSFTGSFATITNGELNGSANLEIISLPNSITNIKSTAFADCLSLREIHIAATNPPTLAATSLRNLPSTAKIYVPSASLSAYQSATNWSTYASQMVGE